MIADLSQMQRYSLNHDGQRPYSKGASLTERVEQDLCGGLASIPCGFGDRTHCCERLTNLITDNAVKIGAHAKCEGNVQC